MIKKQYDLADPSHIEEVRALLMDEDDADPAVTEDLREESDISSDDEVEVRETDSETEQEANVSSSEDEDESTGEYFMGRDKSTKWYQEPPRKKRRANHNIITHLPGVKGEANNAKTSAEC